MKTFNEALRYEYNLNSDSIVIDGGGYQGQWFSEIFKRYGCNIHVYEPVYRNNLECQIKAYDIGGKDKIQVRRAALGGRYGGCVFKVNGDSSGRFAIDGTPEQIEVCGISDIVNYYKPVDLLKLNIEGMEFEVLESLIESGQIKNIKNIQVQWHMVFPDYKLRYEELTKKLNETHEQEWDSIPVWENWRLRE